MRRPLGKLFYPQRIAAIGASDKAGSVGAALIRNLLESEYKGEVFPVNLRHKTIMERPCFRNVKEIPGSIDLAIIATPIKTVLELVKECGKKKIEAVVIISSGFKEAGEEGAKLQREILAVSRKFGIRIVGPNSLGFINTTNGLNASFASRMALKGNVAFLSQSGALCTSILDWSVAQKVGLSYLISTGSTVDVDFHDLINYFGTDPSTSCILIYMESLGNARAFMSAARAYARSKPIIVLKSGKSDEGALAALTHTGLMAGNDLVFDAAFNRAGVVRVETISHLFHCAHALSQRSRPKGNRLAIITNAGGPGVLATDYLIAHGGHLPSLSKSALEKLRAVMSYSWRYKEDVEASDDTTSQQYAAALKACLDDAGVDGVLVIMTPQDDTISGKVAAAISVVAKGAKKPVFASWMGEADVEKGREILEENDIPHFRYPERAIYVFLKLYGYYNNIELLYEFTPEMPQRFVPDRVKAANLIAVAIKEGRDHLTEKEGLELLESYEIPVNHSELASSADEAVVLAEKIGYPVVLKMTGDGLVHKTDFKGVELNISGEKEVRKAYKRIIKRSAEKTNASHENVLVEKMVHKDMEVLIGAKKDDLFGPVILFGMGGIAVEVFKDLSYGLPPLNMVLAKRMIEKTKIYQLLKGYRNLPGVDLEDLQLILQKFSYLVMDLPQIKEIDINPFAMDEHGGVVLDAKVVLDLEFPAKTSRPYQHLVISPYPSQYEKEVVLRSGDKVLLRPIRPEDESLEEALYDRLSKDTIYFRFFGYAPNINHQMLSRFTHIDYDREMAIVAEIEDQGVLKLIGVVRYIADAWNEKAEYAIVVDDKWQGKGLGNILTEFILEIAKERGVEIMEADVLGTNEGMKYIFKKHNFAFNRTDVTEWHVEKEL